MIKIKLDIYYETEGKINMSRPTTKKDLLTAAAANYEKLNVLISELTKKELNTPFDFSGDEKKKEAHWKRDKNLRDILIHLYEWHQLLINWVRSNQNGDNQPFIPKPYNWKTYGEMNVEFWKKHQTTSLEAAKDMLEKSHAEVLKLAEAFTNEELFSKGSYKWVGGSTLGSYFVSTTASHYDWAMKKLKAHKKNCAPLAMNRKMKYTVVLFDLDGTLTDPGEGITNSVMYSLKKYGIEVTERSTLYCFIGPPLHESYKKYFLFSHEQAREAIGYYREYYAEKGIFENSVYEGIRPMLETLKEKGVLCLLATSKPEKYARQILEHYELSDYFYYVAGAGMDGSRTDKAEVISYALEHMPGNTDQSRILMVGDRLHDIAGAKKNRIDSVGVLFGYGSEQELKEAGADYLAANVEELTGIILGE